jgi:hypothetical protein
LFACFFHCHFPLQLLQPAPHSLKIIGRSLGVGLSVLLEYLDSLCFTLLYGFFHCSTLIGIGFNPGVDEVVGGKRGTAQMPPRNSALEAASDWLNFSSDEGF